MLSTQFVELNELCKHKPELPTHICVTRPQWVKTEKDNELASSGDFLIKSLFWIFNLQWEYYVLGLFCRKPWFTEVISISPMDQTKFFQLRTALLWESEYGCMTTRRLIIQWSQTILIIDVIISRKLLLDQRLQTIRVFHEWNTKTTLFQSKRVLVPELLTYSRENRLPNRLIQITRMDQTLPL